MLNKILIAVFLLVPARLAAEDADRTILIGMAGEVLAPVGESLKEFYNTGFGVSLRGQYGLSKNFALILTAGYTSFPSDPPDGVTVEDGAMITAVGGAKVIMPAGSFRFFAAFDAGFTSLERSVRGVDSNQSVSSSSGEFTWQPHLGFEANLGQNSSVEISSRYVGIQGNESVGFRIGILFGI